MEEKAQSKMRSRKFWLTVWSAATANIVMFFSIVKGYDAAWMAGTLALLVGVVTAYVAIGATKQKKEE